MACSPQLVEAQSRWERIVPSLRSRPRKRVNAFSPPTLLLLRTDLFFSDFYNDTQQADQSGKREHLSDNQEERSQAGHAQS